MPSLNGNSRHVFRIHRPIHPSIMQSQLPPITITYRSEQPVAEVAVGICVVDFLAVKCDMTGHIVAQAVTLAIIGLAAVRIENSEVAVAVLQSQRVADLCAITPYTASSLLQNQACSVKRPSGVIIQTDGCGVPVGEKVAAAAADDRRACQVPATPHHGGADAALISQRNAM